jgi:hypothetical protein
MPSSGDTMLSSIIKSSLKKPSPQDSRSQEKIKINDSLG